MEKTSLGGDARKHFSEGVLDCCLEICLGTGKGKLEANAKC